MTKKIIILTGSALIGLISILAILFTLIATGAIDVEQKTIVFSSANAEAIYSGDPLTAGGWEITSGKLQDGHVARVTVSGSQTTVGSSLNSISATIVDENGADVSDYYTIEYQPGTLRVFHRSIQVLSGTASKEYDGTPISCEQFSIAAGELPAGHTVVPTYISSLSPQSEAGTYENKIAVMIKDASGQDVTANYNVLTISGSLNITKRRLTYQTGSASQTYDRSELTCHECELISGELLDDHTAAINFSASQTNAGTAVNKVAIDILDANDNSVASNYEIEVVNGTLTVLPIQITISTDSDSKFYDGQPLTNSGWDQISGEFLSGDILHVDMRSSITNAGTALNEPTITVKNGDNDVTRNYQFNVIKGNLIVTAQPFTIMSGSKTKEYDGTPLECKEAYPLDFILPSHLSLSYTFTTQITNAGTVENVFTAILTDNEGHDVSSNYNINCIYGNLTVTPIRIACKSDDIVEFYSERFVETTVSNCKMISGQLLPGHSISFIPTMSSTDVVDTTANFYVVIKNEHNIDVTSNYAVDYIYGKFCIMPYTIKIITPSAHHTYDGEPFSRQSYSIDTGNSLLPGHSIDYVTFSDASVITDVGRIKNDISTIKIVNGSNQDVTRNYYIDKSGVGEITVTPRQLVIRTPDASKYYDGLPLTAETWEVVSVTQPLETHKLEVAVSGIITEVGRRDNVIAEIKITDITTNEVVTRNYDITKQLGVLTVKDANGEVPNDPAGDLDESGSIGGVGNNNDNTVCLKVYSAQSGPVYLRMQSYGDFNPGTKGWGSATEYGYLLDGKFSYNYLASVALKNSGLGSTRIDIESFMGDQYFIPYFPDMYDANYDVQTSDVVYSGDASDIYSLYYYLFSGYFTGITANLGEYADEELRYRSFVKQNYLYVDPELRLYMQNIINENGFDASSETIIYDVATYIQNAATYTLEYNPAIDYADHPIIAFLIAKEGKCSHYASAATALFRTLGIPARYTVGFAGNTKAQTWTEITAKQAHAWTEVYIDGIGWLPIEVTGASNESGGGPGAGGIGGISGGDSDSGGSDIGGDNSAEEGKALKIRPKTTYHKHDGEYHTPDDLIDGLSELIKEGYTYTASVTLVSGDAYMPGIYETRIEDFVLYDSEKNDVTEEFSINMEDGYMQIYLKEITVSTGGDSKVYDGMPLTSSEYTITGDLLSGHSIQTLNCTGSQTTVGKSTNNFNITIVDENGKNVTSHYKVNRSCSQLTVTPKSLTITANSATQEYTGSALTDKGYTIEGDTQGYTVSVVVSGSQLNVGYSTNKVIKVTVTDRKGVDVTSNFEINCINGTLEVIPSN